MRFFSTIGYSLLGEYLPTGCVKGSQPNYIESLDPEGIPVINTLSIQNLMIVKEFCRYITIEDFEAIPQEKKPQIGDVLLTCDGGVSIGKPVLFQETDNYAIDSHIMLLRPNGIDPKVLVYLLASPIGQIQFNKAESGASGQTAVTEEDIRRFKIPNPDQNSFQEWVNELDRLNTEIRRKRELLKREEDDAWNNFMRHIL